MLGHVARPAACSRSSCHERVDDGGEEDAGGHDVERLRSGARREHVHEAAADGWVGVERRREELGRQVHAGSVQHADILQRTMKRD
jgi:hypothetical protein